MQGYSDGGERKGEREGCTAASQGAGWTGVTNPVPYLTLMPVAVYPETQVTLVDVVYVPKSGRHILKKLINHLPKVTSGQTHTQLTWVTCLFPFLWPSSVTCPLSYIFCCCCTFIDTLLLSSHLLSNVYSSSFLLFWLIMCPCQLHNSHSQAPQWLFWQ